MFRNLFMPPAHQVLLAPASGTEQEEREQRFFSSLRLQNGTLKVTSSRRHDDLNALILRHLPSKRPLDVMDVGISSGVTTLEWLRSLQAAGIECRMVGGDLTAHGLLWDLGGAVRILTEDSGYPLQYEVLGLAVGHPARRRDRFLFFLPAFLSSWAMRRAVASRRSVPESSPAQTPWLRHRRVPLVSPRLLAAGEAVEIVDDDLMKPWSSSRRFDVVRVANVLNPASFSEEQLVRGLSSLRQRLAPGGLLIICRTCGKGAQGENHASVLRLKADLGLEVVGQLRGGSELEPLALRAASP